MNLDKLNQWLVLLANIGVLVGLVFLIIEVNQANRIAIYTAESTRSSQYIAMNTSRIENPGIIAKLMRNESEFTDEEWVQAIYVARQNINTWIDAENAHRNGLLSDTTYKGVMADISVVIDEMPGIIPAFDYLLNSYDMADTDLETMLYLSEAIADPNKQSTRP